MGFLVRGRYRTRLAESDEDIRAAQELRHAQFIAGRNTAVSESRGAGIDADEFDTICQHVLIEETKGGRLVCCFRFLPLENGTEIARSYSARHYDLSLLQKYPGRLVEMGRFCIDPAYRDADVLRVAWGAMTQYVDQNGVDMLFGCSSFAGTEADAHMDAFTLLKERHLAPKRFLPRVKAPNVFRFASQLRRRKPNLPLAMKAMPPLLRSYLVMGGWVSDHAVVDNDLDTLHVFTGLEVARVPARRAQLLRQVSA